MMCVYKKRSFNGAQCNENKKIASSEWSSAERSVVGKQETKAKQQAEKPSLIAQLHGNSKGKKKQHIANSAV